MARRERQDPAAIAASETPEKAERLIHRMLQRRPRDAAALEALGTILEPQSRVAEIATPLVAVAMAGNASERIFTLACAAANERREFEASLRLARKGTLEYPDSPTLWHLRGRAELATSDAPSAAVSLERAHELAPDDLVILARLADADLSRGAFPIPDRFARALLDREPHVAAHHVRLGTAHRFNDRLDEAEACFRRAIELDPSLQSAQAGLAETLESMGQSDAAADQLAPLLEAGTPSFSTVTAWARVQQRLGHPEEAIAAMERYLATNRGIASHKSNVLMRLGRAYEQAGRFDDAFRCWTQGNQTHRGRWNPDAREQFVDTMIETLDAQSLRRLPHASEAPFTPVLIVGMYRSGTTLTEQILSAHPDVRPCGESPAMPMAIQHLAGACGTDGFPGTLASADVAAVEAARDIYVEEVTRHAQDGGTFLTDKLPMNYLNVGIANLLLPNARVLHVVRDPMDTALSCYSQSFTSRMAFTADLEHLGRTIMQERRIMRHWAEACELPMLELRYEDLTANPQQVLQGVLEFLDLPWTEDILRFHESRRVAATPSMDQVRKPINRSAVGRASHFEAYLGPLRVALGME
ncbi:MAG: sulfotransferase [Phycisphaerales bacterium]|jgi:tetratricopeptide (TPR) repeat protein|nr:sulfotransferase [Phycisphaerales bacterium]